MGIVTGLDLIHNKTTSGVFKKDSETIDWQGKHPFFTTKTIKNYKGGHYHYACKVPITQSNDYISGVFKQFKFHNAFWDITIFHQDFSTEINNYSCTIYEDDASVLPEHQAFCMIINEPQIQFKTIDLEISEGGSYYFNDKTPNEIMTVLKAMLSELKAQGTKGFLTVFNPICQSYYEISATINSLAIKEDLIARLLSSCSFVNQNKVTHILKRLPDGTVDIEGTYQQNSTPMGITITDDDLLKGDCYFDKFYNHQVFETLLTTIAKHFCACFLSCWELLEENGLDIYYHNQEDKKRIATHFKNLEGFEDYEVRFVQV